MRKAQKRMAADLRYVDAVLEIRDARLPRGSGNSELGQLIDNKPRLLIFNKAALSDPDLNRQWAAYYREKEIPTLFMDAATKSGLNLILPPLKKLTAPRAEKFLRRGIRPPPGRLMVIGMPNVGKSTFINRLVSKTA
ncbi:MAG: 50S ribosome-binding GTPase [SAR324 cluster bacterium]|nr:50S ribosome-binding GTPase [SAR324 cluster bacterium]